MLLRSSSISRRSLASIVDSAGRHFLLCAAAAAADWYDLGTGGRPLTGDAHLATGRAQADLTATDL